MVIYSPTETTFRLEVTPYGKVLFGVDLQEFYKDISEQDYLFFKKEVFGDPLSETR